ncbi:acyltransferase family protein [Phreatobacter sp.]|uniref:acyltransferase family protein n=1 Tax=Phreatobacter sp. TaxID=1966341 RepID=UPI003F712CEA
MAQDLPSDGRGLRPVPLSNTDEEDAIIANRPDHPAATHQTGKASSHGPPLQRLASIQSLRAAAALSVVAYHVAGEPLVIGAAGVDVFFVISGFVIGLITVAKPPAPVAFAYDRATRVLPLYWFFTALLVATKLLAPDLLPNIPRDAGWFAQSFLLIPAAIPGSTTAFPVLHQGWTLWYEALFYALAVAAIVLAPRRQAMALTAMILALVAAGMALSPEGAIAATYTSPLLVEFLAGYWFAIWRARGGRPGTGLAVNLIAGAVMGLTLAAVHAGSPEGWLRLMVWGVPAIALVIGAVALEDSGQFAERRLLNHLGDASYAIYLSHGIAISVLTLVLRRLDTPLESAIDQPMLGILVVVLSVLAGLAVHALIERPMMDGFRRLRSRLFVPPVRARAAVPYRRPVRQT